MVSLPNIRVPSVAQPLADWMLSFAGSEEYRELVRQLDTRKGRITSASEVAMIYGALQYLRPAISLEIGTFFGATTFIMAEAIVNARSSGSVVTIDPFGAHRVPAILAAWPEELRRVVDFKPLSSMDYFLSLETNGMAKGNASPLGLVFIDGHHNFEYGLFDIIRSADHLRPGGVVFVDNVEQEGPKAAVLQFLEWNPGWSVFNDGRIWTPDFERLSVILDNGVEQRWVALLSPPGVQISPWVAKFMKRMVSYAPLEQIQLNPAFISHPGVLEINVCYYAVPHDYHLTGTGLEYVRSKDRVAVVPEAGQPPLVHFDPPLTLNLTRRDINVACELELRFRSEETSRAYMLLDAAAPFELHGGLGFGTAG